MQINVNDIALPLGTILNGRYKVNQIYYWGYLNILYQCNDMTTGNTVMVKEFCPYALCNRDLDGKTILCKGYEYESTYHSVYQSFIRECDIIKDLCSRNSEYIYNIVKYLDDFTENNTRYFVTDMAAGYSLDEIIEKKIPFNKMKVMSKMTGTIEFLHQCNILHLDIKPSNVIVTENGDVVLIDFGNAMYIGRNQKENIFVSKGFSAPELYHQGKISTQTDIYSLGALFYYLLSGSAPPAADKRLEGEPIIELSRMVTIAYPIEDCIMRALQLNPEKRFRNLSLLEKILRY